MPTAPDEAGAPVACFPVAATFVFAAILGLATLCRVVFRCASAKGITHTASNRIT